MLAAWRTGALDYLAGAAPLASPAALGAHRLIGWEESVGGINAAEWLAKIAPASAVVYRTTHQDLRRTARVRGFFDVVTAGIGADRALIEGAVTDPRAPLSSKAGSAQAPASGIA
jgi:hypothetical protein